MSQAFGIIFDCDGTLVDSLGQALLSFNYALQELGESPRSPEAIKKYFGTSADRIFLELLGDKIKAMRAFELYLDCQAELAKKTPLHDGIGELLEALAAKDVALGIVTGRHARDLALVLRPHGIESFFKVLVADSDLVHSKPSPEGILKAAKALGLSPGDTCYVGDSMTDVQAARRAGSISIAALWDALAHKADLEQEKPDFLADLPRDVLAILSQLKGL